MENRMFCTCVGINGASKSRHFSRENEKLPTGNQPTAAENLKLEDNLEFWFYSSSKVNEKCCFYEWDGVCCILQQNF